ncbi:MAG: oxidoreductase [Bacteroidia bacterium]
MKNKSRFTFILLLFLASTLNAQELILYNVTVFETGKKNIGFISLSDKYLLSEHPDSLAIPDLEEKGIDSAQYFKLKGTYRQRFFSGTKIKETDKVFIYDYSADLLLSFPLNELDVVACLNIYRDANDWPYSQYDYMIGFAIDTNLLKGMGNYFSYTLVAIGKENPFVKGKIAPVIWKKTGAENFPAWIKNTKRDAALREYGYNEYTEGDVYTFEAKGFQYFTRDILNTNGQIFARQLVVINSKTKAAVCENVYFESESASLAPLNTGKITAENPGVQWTGKLFRKKPPVIFGFEYQSFGCPGISFLDLSENDIYINCDNRN